jgi:hypothetical protein
VRRLLIPSAGIAQQLANCENTPTVIACTPTGPSGTGTGDQPWYAFGILNQDNLTSWATLQPPLNGVINTTGNTNTTQWGSTPLPCADLPPLTGNVTTSGCASTITSLPSGTVVTGAVITPTGAPTAISAAVVAAAAAVPIEAFWEAGDLDTVAVSVTSATPAVFTGITLSNGAAVVLGGTTAPIGFTLGTTYYVVATSGITFRLAATAGGAPIASSSTGTAVTAIVPGYAAAFARAYAGCFAVRLGPYSYPIGSNIDWPSTCPSMTIVGTPGVSTLQRDAAGAGLQSSAPASYMNGVTVDCNEAALGTTNGQYCFVFATPGQATELVDVKAENMYGDLGSCLAFIHNGSLSIDWTLLDKVEITNCNARPLYLASTNNVVGRNLWVHDDPGGGGVNVQPSGTPSSTNYSYNIDIQGRFERDGTGVALGGWSTPYTFTTPGVVNARVHDSQFIDNSSYDLSMQGSSLTADHNQFTVQSVAPVAGIDCNGNDYLINDNIFDLPGAGNAADCGGTNGLDLAHNDVTMTTGGGWNLGGVTNGTSEFNTFWLSNGAGAISAQPQEGSGVSIITNFPNVASNIHLWRDKIIMSGSATIGVRFKNNACGTVGANPCYISEDFVRVSGAGSGNDIILWGLGSAYVVQGNTDNGSSVTMVDPGANSLLMIDPVFDEAVGISSTTKVNGIESNYQYAYGVAGAVLFAYPLTGGSGYSAATVLNLSGTGCIGTYTGVADINQGVILGVNQSNGPQLSGCTGTVTITATDSGGGTGATFAAVTVPSYPAYHRLRYSSAGNNIVNTTGFAGIGAIANSFGTQIQTVTGVPIDLEENSTGTGWNLVNAPIPIYAVGAQPTCNTAATGEQAYLTGSASGKFNARCNGTAWLWSDGTAIGAVGANKVVASPNGSAGDTTPRSLVNADFPATGVSAASYTNSNITVNAQGLITAAANGSGGGASPGGSAYSTQYYLTSTTLGGTGPGTSGQVLTSTGSGSAPTYQAPTGITALTGDGTASGGGSVPLTIVSSNGNLFPTAAAVLGDIWYASSASTLAKLAGNITTTALCLQQTGTGSVSAPPVWGACGGGGIGSANPTAAVGLTTVNGSAATFMRSDAAPALSQAIAPTWTAQHIWNFTGQSANTDVAATLLENTTPAATGAQQFMCTQLSGQGWKTTATAASQTVDWKICNEPVQGTTNPFENIIFYSQINGGGYTAQMTLASTGNMTVAGSVTADSSGNGILSAGPVTLGSPSLLSWSGRGILTSPAANDVQVGSSTTASAPSAQTISTQGETGTNVSGAGLTIQSGIGTGTGTGSTLTLGTPHNSGTSGTTAQVINAQVVMGDNSVSMPNLAASSAATTGTVCWTTGGNLTVDTTLGCLGGSTYIPASVAITGGTINGTAVGSTAPSTGAFTNFSYTGTFTGAAGSIALADLAVINPGDVLCNSGTAAASPADCPTSSTRYSSASVITIGSGDNGGIIVQNFNGNWSTVLAQSGTTGFPAGSFSAIIYNAQGGIGTITPTTSTINGLATVYMPPYSAALLTADNTSSPGNYNFISLGFLNDGAASISLLGAADNNAGISTYQGATKYWGLYQGGATPPVFNLYDYYGSRYIFEANPNGPLEVMPNGGLTEIGGGTESIGTTFTLGTGTGACATSSTLIGGAVTGSFKCTGTAGASTQVINLPTAANGWWCTAFDTDTTTPTVLGQVGPIATTSCKVSGSISVTSDVITFHAEAY